MSDRGLREIGLSLTARRNEGENLENNHKNINKRPLAKEAA